ncbi:MAG: hypothetical protein ACYTGC_13015, partial [Planctomycetota bacterium]
MHREMVVIATVLAFSAAQADPSLCGHPDAGSCCVANGTPACDDAECCNIVCSIFPFCCEFGWDEYCALVAFDLCPPCSAGACCLPDGGCLDMAGETECFDLGGSFQGALSSCDQVTCTPICGPGAGD